ncbi:hypothetical protein [Pseudomonas allokribbensis]|uniref:hypothetical protein n=1 Tax=Pseudomonas allokribbensis TaxID=2774460 RepID=UPI0017881908|nr:hypothetical protein [Pseudomonas allokribbensis]
MIKSIIFAALGFLGVAQAFAAAESTSVSMSFEKCQSVQANTIAELNVSPGDIAHVVNTSMLTITKIYTADGSILISCSNPDQKMVITKSTDGR